MSDEQQTPPSPAPENSAAGEITPEQARDLLRVVIDPDLNINIVDLGLVYDVRIPNNVIEVDMTFTTPGCPWGPYLVHQVKDTLAQVPGVSDTKVTVVWDPPWGPAQMSEEVRLELGFDL